MSYNSSIATAILEGPQSVFGHSDPSSAMIGAASMPPQFAIRKGIVEQFNVGLYSASVVLIGEGGKFGTGSSRYVCLLGACHITNGFGYSDATLLREGDTVLFIVTDSIALEGMILTRIPSEYARDEDHTKDVESDTELERRTDFFSSSGYRRESQSYTMPLQSDDLSLRACINNRPTDVVPGEFSLLNQHKCGLMGGIFSTTIYGGGAHIKLFALENRIRIIADSMMQSTLSGNANDWHNRRYLSQENATCIYQEERLGLDSQDTAAFEEADYHKDGYFTKNKAPRQTAKPRIVDYSGYYGNLMSRYCLRPDPKPENTGEGPDNIRSMDMKPIDAGVARESIDPSGQYRLAATGMLGMERIGRIPVPVRVNYPWQKESSEPEASELRPFQHDEEHPYYRQLELADRVAYDLKNSYSRVDGSTDEFFTPEEEDISGEHQLKDIYDPGFTESETVSLQKYDKRRSGIWQGEDGSIILRDAWGSEIVMIGGNIQLSCAGNIEILPGKTALTLAGDDIVNKAQHSIDIEAAENDVRVNAVKNVQILAGIDDEHPGGITLESKGKSAPWDADSGSGEELRTLGILVKSDSGNFVTDVDTMVLRSKTRTGLVSGNTEIAEGDGQIFISAGNVYEYGESVIQMTESSALMLSSSSATLVGESAILAGSSSASIFKGDEVLIPLMWIDASNVAETVLSSIRALVKIMSDEKKVSFEYGRDDLKKMKFKFRSTKECGTDGSWEIDGPENFTLYQPFWLQVHSKFDTLKSVSTETFNDYVDIWGEPGNPWPGTEAVKGSAKFAKLSNDAPVNMTDDGFNKARKEVSERSGVTEMKLFDGYTICK